MASYKFKIIKGGKVIGEATTRADADAAAKKYGGTVVETVGAVKKPSPTRRDNPAGVPHRVYYDDRSGVSPGWVAEYYDAYDSILTTSEHAGHPDMPTRRDASKRAHAIAAKFAADLAKKRNPPLEPTSAATLLDAVKPGAPQQIHGVKVARVGAGYSVDGKAMTRAQVLKALEAGRASNPKQNAHSGGSTMSADDYVRFCHAYAISRVLEGASKDRALLAVRQLGTLAQNGDPIRIDRTIRDAWASAKLPGKPTEKALHDGATAFVSSAADRETNPKGKKAAAKASGRKIQYV